jgi:hypothetical protein
MMAKGFHMTWTSPLRTAALLLPLIVYLAAGQAQVPEDASGEPQFSPRGARRLPGGRAQRDALLKAEYEQNLKDAARLVELSGDLKRLLENSERYVLSVEALKKTDEIEKLAKKIHSRISH